MRCWRADRGNYPMAVEARQLGWFAGISRAMRDWPAFCWQVFRLS